MFKLIVGIGVAVAICLAGTGCGGGSSQATSASLSKAQFIKQADALCDRLAKQRAIAIEAWWDEFPGGRIEAEKHSEEGFQKVIVPSIRQKAVKLAALTPPRGDEVVVSRLVTTLSKVGDELAKKGKQGVAHSGIRKFEREAAAYGLESCRTV